MSDFTSNFWSVYVAGITIVGILGCLLLLWMGGKGQASSSGDATTGHVWDVDLKEMNNPLPRWWVWLFIITCVFGLVYLVLFPGAGSFKGALGWSETRQFDEEMAAGDAQVAPIYAAFANKSIVDLSKDPQAMAIGDRLFMNNCSQCHASDARGAIGFPDLTDKHWNWGGTPDEILETITNGRIAVMAPVAAQLGSPEDVRAVANYALSLSKDKGTHFDAALASKGQAKFAEVCAVCHGADGKGNKLLGSNNLTDGVFTFGLGTEAHVIDMVTNGKMGQMPAWGEKAVKEQGNKSFYLSAAKIKVLAAYVWGKGGGLPPEPVAAAAPQAAAEGEAK
ncbi:MAG: cytochrome-c oxidase, cbb3-type subunit III [Desulfovibrionaceae bacterium]|jgi:cytochrome c oxidase cbb3-type subunit 3|nr:cytochrome-c oxidase, cbb3-type subunit III [Desulfovibrionaceae bacterium]